MKRNIRLAMLAVILTTGSLLALNVTASGPIQKEDISVTPFTRLDVRTQFDVYLSQGDKEDLVLETYKSLKPYVKVEQNGNTLNIFLDRKINNIHWMGQERVLRVYVTVKEIEKVSLSGACDLYMETDLKAGEFRIDASGASDLNMKKVSAKKISINTSGASDLRDAQLDAEDIYVNASGASDGNLSLTAVTARIIASGSSDFDITADVDKLRIDALGSSDFHAQGRADDLILNVSGSSSMQAADLKTVNAEVDASGSSDCRVQVSGFLKASSSGASSIYYTGLPRETSISVSGVASVKSK